MIEILATNILLARRRRSDEQGAEIPTQGGRPTETSELPAAVREARDMGYGAVFFGAGLVQKVGRGMLTHTSLVFALYVMVTG